MCVCVCVCVECTEEDVDTKYVHTVYPEILVVIKCGDLPKIW